MSVISKTSNNPASACKIIGVRFAYFKAIFIPLSHCGLLILTPNKEYKGIVYPRTPLFQGRQLLLSSVQNAPSLSDEMLSKFGSAFSSSQTF